MEPVELGTQITYSTVVWTQTWLFQEYLTPQVVAAIIVVITVAITLKIVLKLTAKFRVRFPPSPKLRSACCKAKVEFIANEGHWMLLCKKCQKICETLNPNSKKGGNVRCVARVMGDSYN